MAHLSSRRWTSGEKGAQTVQTVQTGGHSSGATKCPCLRRLLPNGASAAAFLLGLLVASAAQTSVRADEAAAASAAAAGRGAASVPRLAEQASASAFAFGRQYPAPAAAPYAAVPQRRSHFVNKAEKLVNSLLDRLAKLESEPTFTLDDCQRWANLNERYAKLVGARRQLREGELVKLRECQTLGFETDDIYSRLYSFRENMLDETNQLETVSNLVADFVDIRLAAASDSAASNYLDGLRLGEPQFSYSIDRLESFLRFIESKLAQLNGGAQAAAAAQTERELAERVATALAAVQAGYVPNRDDVADLETAARQLIDREPQLDEREGEQLLAISDAIELYLNDGASLSPKTGRWRYLFGVVEAARGVVLRELRADERPPVEQQVLQEARVEPQMESEAEAYADDGLEWPQEARETAAQAAASAAAYAVPNRQGGVAARPAQPRATFVDAGSRARALAAVQAAREGAARARAQTGDKKQAALAAARASAQMQQSANSASAEAAARAESGAAAAAQGRAGELGGGRGRRFVGGQVAAAASSAARVN